MPRHTETRRDYRHFLPLMTRWQDNDIFGHVNNVVYYSYIDTAVTNYYFDPGGHDVINALVVPVAAETKCTFRRSIAHPANMEAGVRADRIGTTSVQVGVGLFLKGEAEARAFGHMVHVFVDRVTNKPVPIPGPLREALVAIEVPARDGH